jgi:hypothetical protein
MTNTKIGQVKFIFIKEMDHKGEGRLHPFVVMAQEGETLKGFGLSSVQCKEFKGEQKGFFVKDRVAYPAFNHGEFEISVSEFGGPVVVEMGKADRNQIKVEFSRFQKAFG